MFAFSDTFDSYFLELEDPATSTEETELKRVCRKVLRENIVNPLRQNFFCPAESVCILRDLLKPLSDKVDGAFMGKLTTFLAWVACDSRSNLNL